MARARAGSRGGALTEVGSQGGEQAGAPPPQALPRVVGVPGAVLLGLGSILGTGVFVSLGTAAGVAGAGVLPALVLAGGLAACNGLSSAQLAAAHPVSGGTYEYGYRLLRPSLGFLAGWTFLWAKSASAATAALGAAGYLLRLLGLATAPTLQLGFALAAVALTTLAVAGGIRRANWLNAVIVGATACSLTGLIALGLPVALGPGLRALADLWPPAPGALPRLLEATALMFVAFTGYGRIATLGEEVREPARSIPRAIGWALGLALALYLGVALVAIGAVGAPALAAAAAQRGAPLELAAARCGGAPLAALVALGAVTAMLGVLLNLILGLSRVLLAMARRGDLPRGLAELEAAGASPRRAVLLAGGWIALLVGLVDVKATWSFSAFTVLVYYAVTNAAALRLPPEARLFPRALAGVGLVACLALAWWVEVRIWSAGLAVIALGQLWHEAARRRAGA